MTLNSFGLQTLIHFFFSLMYKNYLISGNLGEVCICFVPEVGRRRSSPCRAIICCTCEVWDQGQDVNDEQSNPLCLLSQSLSPQSLPVVRGSRRVWKGRFLLIDILSYSLWKADMWRLRFFVCVFLWEFLIQYYCKVSPNFLVSQPRR